MTFEMRVGWIGSVAVHLATGALLFLVKPPQPLPQQEEFVELTFGGGASLGPMPKGDVLPEGASSPAAGAASPPGGAGVSVPASMTAAANDEAAPTAPAGKLDAGDNLLSGSGEMKGMADARREAPATALQPGFAGGKGNAAGVPGLPAGSDVALPFNAGGVGGSIASNISYSIQWSGGAKRDLLSGDLPKYPAGVSVDAQIKLKVVVQPRGTVKSVQPLRKGDTRLEDAAMKEVRLWRFERLQSAQPALDQVCTITFNFRVR